MSAWTQVREITLMNLRSIPERLGPSLVIVVGIAGVVGVLVALLSMATGLRETLGGNGRTDQVVIARGGSNGELASFLSIGNATLVKQDPAIARNADGAPLASAELIVITEVRKPGSRNSANVSLRGIEPIGLTLRDGFRLTSGRMFRPGVQELIVGTGAAGQFDGLEVGRSLKFRGSTWAIVGHFESGGIYDSELWSDVQTVQSAWRRAGVSSVLAQLKREGDLPVIAKRLKDDPQLDVEAKSQKAFYTGQSSGLTTVIGIMAAIIALMMALGAVFGALNTMYAAVSARTREIGTLRALGFGALPVIVSVMAESLILSVSGGVLGAVVAYIAFNGYAVSTLSGISQVAFQFAVTPQLVAIGLSLAIAIGFIGGLAPAIRAARIPVTSALRE